MKLTIFFIMLSAIIVTAELYPKSVNNEMFAKSFIIWILTFMLSYVPLVGFLLYMSVYQMLTSHLYIYAVTKIFMITLLVSGFITLITSMVFILFLIQKLEMEMIYS